MQTFSIACLSCIIYVAHVSGFESIDKNREAKREQKGRLSWLLRYSSNTDLIPITGRIFEQLLTPAPRKYSLFILFTSSRRTCLVCRQAEINLGIISKQYQKLFGDLSIEDFNNDENISKGNPDPGADTENENTFLRRKAVGAVKTGKKSSPWLRPRRSQHISPVIPKKPNLVFFVKIDSVSESETFENFGVETPRLVHYKVPIISSYFEDQASKDATLTRSQKLQRINAVGRDILDMLMDGELLEDQFTFEQRAEYTRLLRYVNDRAGLSLSPMNAAKRRNDDPNETYAILFLICGVAYIAYSMRDLPWRNHTLYFALSMIIYGFCISGGMFNILRGTPPFAYNPNTGEFRIYDPRSSSQFSLEGYFVGLVNAIIGGLFIVLTTQIHLLDDLQYRDFAVIICIGGVFLTFQLLRNLYTSKNPHYNYGFV